RTSSYKGIATATAASACHIGLTAQHTSGLQINRGGRGGRGGFFGEKPTSANSASSAVDSKKGSALYCARRDPSPAGGVAGGAWCVSGAGVPVAADSGRRAQR